MGPFYRFRCIFSLFSKEKCRTVRPQHRQRDILQLSNQQTHLQETTAEHLQIILYKFTLTVKNNKAQLLICEVEATLTTLNLRV